MNDKSLLSLREIARELNLKYKKILNSKNQMEPFLPGVFDGRNFKYFPECKEILELVMALRGEGYTFSMIREIFLEKHTVENDPQMYEWICECIGKHKHYWTNEDGSECTSPDQSEPEQTGLDQSGPIRANPCWSVPVRTNPTQNKPGQSSTDQSDLIQTGLDKSEPVRTSLTQSEPDRTSLDQSGSIQSSPDEDKPVQAGTDQSKPGQPDPDQDKLAHSGTDLAAQIRTSLNEAKQVWLKEVEVLIRSLLAEQSESTQKVLQKMATQSNIAITALCESTQDIRNGLLSINDRLARLERDLDVEAAEPLEIYEVDARNYQLDLPEITLPDITPPLTADLEPGSEPGLETTPETTPDPTPQDLSDDHDLGSVRDSIDNGIPDRDVLVDWAMEKRQQDENTYSYNVLAGILNKSAIPTMSGREKWSRSTVRNLLVRTLKNRE
jgi:hypothetical protein